MYKNTPTREILTCRKILFIVQRNFNMNKNNVNIKKLQNQKSYTPAVNSSHTAKNGVVDSTQKFTDDTLDKNQSVKSTTPSTFDPTYKERLSSTSLEKKEKDLKTLVDFKKSTTFSAGFSSQPQRIGVF